MADDTKIHAVNALLRVVAAHASILEERAFAELAAVLARIVSFDRLSILVPDAPMSLRVYAISNPAQGVVAFGLRFPGDTGVWRELFEEQRAHVTDDMAAGNEVERAAARGGDRSYAAFPMRVPPRVVGLLVLGFAAPGAGRRVPADLVQEIADAIGPSVERALVLTRAHRLAMILETSGDAMLAWDRDGLISDANAAAEALAGRPRAELVGLPVTDLLDPPPVPAAPRAFTEGTRHALLARMPGGTRRVPVAATVTAVSGDAQVAEHALLRDLSRVVRAEAEAAASLARVRELEEQHRALLDNAPLIIFRLDPATGELVYLNRHAERLLGVPLAEALGTPGFLRAAHADPEGAASFDAAVERARAGGLSLPYDARLRGRNGEAISARGAVFPILAEGSRVAAIEGVLADVSAEHVAQRRLVQADRLSTLGTLAAGVAHEINNPAAFIVLGLDMLARTLSGPDVSMDPAVAAAAFETVRELRESIRRIADIIRDLRVFARPPAPGGRALVDVNRTVESALSLTRGQIVERAELERRLEEVPPVLMDDGGLGQAVVNLLVNAVQALRGAGADQRITVATRSDGSTVEIEITDTGPGIPAENMQRIWQPFFTTKGADVGTGLGLSIGRDIVERAGGTLTAESPVGGTSPPSGARFVISLPAAGRDEPSGERASPVPAPPRPARVLVVDDEAALLRALAEAIGHHHEVVTAASGEAALARLAPLAPLADARFDAVLCDLCMPGLSGQALYERVRERDEAQAEAFIFMTGVGFGADVERLMATSGRPVLEKPFPAGTALEAIARVARKRAGR